MASDLQHQLWLITLHDKLYLAPIKTQGPINVLDFGTGTGIWAMEFGIATQRKLFRIALLTSIAIKYPDAHVVGSDLSPIQPELYVMLPPNLEFY
jgi:ubiquinone/menaquinone biosynthesis C-methylase UbiE